MTSCRGDGLRVWFRFLVFLTVTLVLGPVPGRAAGTQALHGNRPAAVAKLTPLGRTDSSKQLDLSIGLPLRNQADLAALLKNLYDPASPQYHHFLTPRQFTDRFGPSPQDYQALSSFAKANGLSVTSTYPNRLLLDVHGSIPQIEKTFHVTMYDYQHPTEKRVFYAPDVEPSVDLAIPLLHISGLDNYALPHPNLVRKPVAPKANAKVKSSSVPQTGSGLNGAYAGNDFRAAYVSGTSLTGTGQSVGLVEFDGYYPSDITSYESQYENPSGYSNVPLVNVAVDHIILNPGSNNDEVSLDIEMAIAMAPGLSNIYVYEAPNFSSNWDKILNRMANDDVASQLSNSWSGGSPNANAEAIFQEMAAQGQSFFSASGDSDAYTGSIPFPCDSPSITVVGGTTLTTSGPAGTYDSETTWNWGGGVGTSGGISTYYSIPTYQQGVSMATNQGSTTMRNVPDVALTADNVYVLYNNGSSGTFGGTSCAAPLWAAFTALVNQQAVANGLSKVGFLNPTLYAIGNGASYSSNFNDITTGNNFSSSSPSQFAATTGYDLCTGLGTPGGTTLINSLAGLPSGPPVIISPLSVTGTKGIAFRYNIVATNHPTSYGASEDPAGLGVNTTTGLISGTPSASGTFNVPVSATNAISTGTATLTIIIQQAPAITDGPPPATVKVNTPYTFTYTATGYPAPTFAVTSGALPTPLSLSSAGVISGTPSATGSYTGTVTASNGVSPAATQSFSIVVQEAPAITNGPPPATVTVNTPYTFAYAASGYPAPTFAVTAGGLPAGLSLSLAGSISGTPMTPGLSTATVTASNGVSPSATQSFSIAVQQAPAITNGAPPAMGTVETPYTFTFTASGYPAPTFSVTSGALPAGLTLSPSGSLSGTPTSAGTYTATVDATNGVGTDATQSITITIVNAADTPAMPFWGLAVLALLLLFVATGRKQLVN